MNNSSIKPLYILPQIVKFPPIRCACSPGRSLFRVHARTLNLSLFLIPTEVPSTTTVISPPTAMLGVVSLSPIVTLPTARHSI